MLRFLYGRGLIKKNRKGGGHWLLSSSSLSSGDNAPIKGSESCGASQANPVSCLLVYGSEDVKNFIFSSG